MTRRHRLTQRSGRVILLADDDADYLEATRILLEAEGHLVHTAENGPAALAVARQHPIELLLLDYFMPGMTGEEVVARLREFDPHVQVVLQTGFSDDQPPRDMLRRLDIQGYYDKSEGPEKLLLWTDAALKAASALTRATRTSEALRQVLDLTPELHAARGSERLFEVVVRGAQQLLLTLCTPPRGAGVGVPWIAPDVLLALGTDAGELAIERATGDLARLPRGGLDEGSWTLLEQAATLGDPRIAERGSVLPLRVGAAPFGALFVHRKLAPDELDLLRLFADQAALSMAPTREAARRDPAASVHPEPYFDHCLSREIRAALRTRRPLSLVTFAPSADAADVERALDGAAAALSRDGRPDAVLGRRAGASLWLLLPHTATRGAQRIARRALGIRSGAHPVFATAGVATLATHVGVAPPRLHPTPALVSMLAALLADRAARARHDTDPGAGVLVRGGEPITWTDVATLPRGDA